MTKREFFKLAIAYGAGLLTYRLKDLVSPPTPPRSLDMRIQGLVLVQKSANAATIHLIDGEQVGMGTHNAQLVVPDALVDPSSTAASNYDPFDSSFRVFELKRPGTVTAITVPGAGTSGPPDLGFDTTPIDVNALPADDAHWQSSNYAAQLGTLTGATAITDNTKFMGRVQLEHGQFHAVRPTSPYGLRTIWDFTAQGHVIPSQVLTDTLVWRINAIGTGPTFLIGSDTVVLKHLPGPPMVVTLRNLPPPGTAGMCSGSSPCLDHLNAIYALVNASFTPTAVGRPQGVMPPDAEPNYCPPAMI